MKEDNINALDEIHKGACMGMDALNIIKDKVEDEKLKKVLDIQYKDYKDTIEKIEEIYPSYNDGQPHKTNAMNKAMTWYNIETKTLADNSSSKLAELLLQGVNMGIIEGKRILNNKNLDKKVSTIISKYVAIQEKSVEVLKEYL